ncbi:cancer/testis antigen 55-like [Rattus norvegicus]|uniref:cancer/testis antigen 55-like n=1 Tax=Rattus norvegicus TaxID=10116 RepID=UPI001916F58F|nr:cancer/testis antigen 55-like [Rattus norvegicus]
MLRILRRILTFFQRKTKPDGKLQLKDNATFKSARGIVTYLCTDYGWINETIFFSVDVVCGNAPLNVGMNVIALVEKDETNHALKNIKVKTMSDPIYGIEPSEADRRLCIKCITAATQDSIYVSKETFFPIQLLSGGLCY